MVKYILLIWVIVYICTIIHHIFEVREINSLISTIEKYLSSAERTGYGKLILKDNYIKCCNELLFRYPRITKHLGFCTPDLNYGNSNETNYSKAIDTYNRMLMHRNYSVDDLKTSFVPTESLKTLFSLPSKVIHWLGFEPKESFSKFINLVCWLAAYLLNLYSDEIKALITSLVQ